MPTIVTIGNETQVNTYTTSDQLEPVVASLSGGGFVVAWHSLGQDGSGHGIFAQRYNASGTAQGSEFLVNSSTDYAQVLPSITGLLGGGFVITWTTVDVTGNDQDNRAQIFDSSGTAVGSEFLVNAYTTGSQTEPFVAALTGGGFVVGWTSDGQDGTDLGTYAQIYSSSGALVGTEFRVNSTTSASERHPNIVGLSDGGFLFTWTSTAQDGSDSGVFGQRYDSSGATVGTEFQVNTYTTGNQNRSFIGSLSDGRYVVGWQSAGQDGSGAGIYAQLYAANGTALGAEFRLNSTTAGDQQAPSIVGLTTGGFAATWMSDGQDGNGNAVIVRLFDNEGSPVSREIIVNNYTTGSQGEPTITSLANGGFVVTWESIGQDGDAGGIYQRTYSSTGVPIDLTTGSEIVIGTTGEDLILALNNGLSTGDVIDGLGGTDTIQLAEAGTLDARNGTLTSIEVFLGSSGNDTIYGTSGVETLNGNGGTDTLVGGSGDDTYVTDGGDTITENANEGTDIVQSSVTYTLGDNLENLTLTGSGNINGTGNALDNVITGNAGNNTLDGNMGTDTLIGGAGHDIYVTDGGDTITENLNEGTDTVQSSVTYTLGDNLENLVLTGSANINGTGNTLNNVITGNSGNNTLSGGDGNDTITGGTGNDTLDGGNDDDTFVYNAANEIAGDTVTGGAGIDTLQFYVSGAINLTNFTALSGIERLVASSGNDTITLPTFRLPGLTAIDAGAGTDSLLLTGGYADLSGVTLTGVESITTISGGNITIRTASLADAQLINGSSATIALDATSFALTAGERTALFAQGIDEIRGQGGIRYYSNGATLTVGSETIVNTVTAGDQQTPAIAALGDGGYAMVWSNGASVLSCRMFNADGTPAGAQFQIDAATSGFYQVFRPAVSALSGGGFVVVWEDEQPNDGDGSGIYMRRIDANGASVGPVVLVNTTTTGYQQNPDVTGLSGGRFVITWQSNVDTGGGLGTFAQIYNADGTPSGGEFRVHAEGAGNQYSPNIIATANGGFIVTFASNQTGSTAVDVWARRFDATGTAIGTEFILNSGNSQNQDQPVIAPLPNGGFVATWLSFLNSAENVAANGVAYEYGIVAQRFDSSGTRVGAEIRVDNPEMITVGAAPTVTALINGGFVVTWHAGNTIATSDREVYAQIFNADGTPLGAEFVVNSTLTDGQSVPEVTALLNGGFVISWASNLQDGQQGGIIQRVYNGDGTLVAPSYTLTTGNDTVNGSIFSETITATPADWNAGDVINGGGVTDRDTLQFTSAGTVNLTTPGTLTGVERILGASTGIEEFIVSQTRLAGITEIDGGGGYSVIRMSATGTLDLTGITLARIDEIFGTTGADTITGSAGDDRITGDSGGDTLNGGGGNDVLNGSSAVDTLNGGDGHDQLYGFGGNDTLNGNDGDDRFYFTTGVSFGAITVNGGAGTDRLQLVGSNFLAAFASMTSIEELHLSNGGSGGATLSSTAAEFNALLSPNLHIIRSTLNTSTVIQVSMSAGGSFSAAGWTFTDWNSSGFISLNASGATTAATITGSSQNDSISGGSANDTLNGGGGNDFIDGRAGADSMTGGAGNDNFVVDDVGDTVIENAGEGTSDSVIASVSFTLGANVEALQLTGSDNINGTGNAENNTLTGNSGNNRLEGGDGTDSLTGWDGNDILDGGTGNDTLEGGNGNDTYVVDSAFDTVIEYLDSGSDTIETGLASYSLATLSNIENLRGTSSSGQSLTGNAGNNAIFGGSGDDFIDGDAGIDTMSGGAGNDTYVVDSVSDAVSEFAGGGTGDLIRTGLSTYSLLSALNVERLEGTSNSGQTLSGNTQDNIISAGAGNDTLDGGAGTDSLIGGLGDDTYIIDSATDTITELSGEGTDTVRANISYTLGAELENLALVGIVNINATGNADNNTIIGNSGGNIINGMAGNDTLTGNAGDDTFVFTETSDSDTITDFVVDGNADRIDLRSFANINSLSQVIALGAQVGADAVFTFGAGNTLTLQGATLANLVADDFYLTPAPISVLNGTPDVDNIVGTSGNDSLDGLASNDRIDGGAGDDRIVYDATDTPSGIFGGLGYDVLVVNSGSGLPTLFNLGAQGFEAAERTTNDVGNLQPWTVLTETFNTSWQLTQEDRRLDDGTRRLTSLDPGGNQSWNFVVQEFDAGGNRTLQSTYNDDGSRIVDYFDTTNSQTWSSFQEAYNTAGERTLQRVYNDGGDYRFFYWDPTNAETWTTFDDQYNAAGQRHTQRIQYDNGTLRYYYWDVSNAQTWSAVDEQFNAANQRFQQTVVNDDGSLIQQYWDVAGTQTYSLLVDYFNAAGQRYEQRILHDAGGFTRIFYDVTNAQPWQTRTDVYDVMNVLTSRTDVPD